MIDSRTFNPQRRPGVVFHFFAIGLLLAVINYGLWKASLAESVLVLVYLIPAVIAGSLLPWFAYRLYGLQSGSYSVARDGIRLRWGWRVEEIPANVVEWVGHDRKFSIPLPRPVFAWPGAVVGERRLPDGKPVEFLASRRSNLVLIVTDQRIFAVSPADPGDFLMSYQRIMEYGSLSPLRAQSISPGFLSASFQADQPGRLLLLGNFLLAIFLFALVMLVVPGREQVSLRFTLQGLPLDYVPAARLFLLPVLNLLFQLTDAVMGLFFYRRVELRPLAYLLWGAGFATSGLFLSAIIFILRIS